jgi:hypothetical protein
MGQPAVHFESIGNDPEELRGYYRDLFGWEFDTPLTGCGRGIGSAEIWVPQPRHSRGRDAHPRWYRRWTGLEARWHTGHGSSHVTERACCRSLHGPGRHSDRRCRRLLRADRGRSRSSPKAPPKALYASWSAIAVFLEAGMMVTFGTAGPGPGGEAQSVGTEVVITRRV